MVITYVALADVVVGCDPIVVTIEVEDGGWDDGVIIGQGGNYRVVVENVRGKLTCHIWATAGSIGNDPTHSIEIDQL